MQTPIPPGQMTPEARIDFIEAIRSRIAAADALRANGKTAEADALDPDSDELNAAVDIVRLIRASRASAPKRTANAAPVPTLADLLKGGA